MIERCFSVRPKPVIDESFQGFCLRIAKVNGRFNLMDLNNDLKLAGSKHAFSVGHPSWLRYTEKLAPMLRQSAVELRNCFQEEDNALLIQKDRKVRSIRCQTPKLCPCCITQHGTFKQDWLKIHVTHCDKHNTLLVDHCPSCSTKLKWNISLFEGCSNCNFKWSDKPQSTAVPAYQRALEDADQHLLFSFYAAYALTLRPNDFILDSITDIELSNSEHHTRCLQAYSLLSSSEVLQQWVKPYEAAGHLSPYINEQPVVKFFSECRKRYSLLTEVNYSAITKRMEFDDCILPKRQKLATQVPLNRHVGYFEAAAFLGIDSSSLERLIELDVINPFYDSYFGVDTLFDLDVLLDLDLLIWDKAQPGKQRSKQLIPISDFYHKLHAFGFGVADLMMALVKHEHPPLYSDGGAHWYELKVNPEEFLVWLGDIYIEALPDEMPAETFRRMCGFERKQSQNLVRNTSLHFKGWSSNEVIVKQVLSEFLSNFVILGQFAQITDVSADVLHQTLLEHGIEPSIPARTDKSTAVYSAKQVSLKQLLALFPQIESVAA